MVVLEGLDLAIGVLELTGHDKIAAAQRDHGRDAAPTLTTPPGIIPA
jgi:hypothetical protein